MATHITKDAPFFSRNSLLRTV